MTVNFFNGFNRKNGMIYLGVICVGFVYVVFSIFPYRVAVEIAI